VSLLDQERGGVQAALPVVDVHGVHAGQVEPGRHDHQRQPLGQRGEQLAGALAEDRLGQHQPVHPPLQHHPQVALLVATGGDVDAGNDEQQAVLAGLRLGARHRLREEVVGHVGGDHAKRVGAVRGESPGEGVGHVLQLLDGAEHPLPGAGGDAVTPVDDPRDRLVGHPGASRHIPDCRSLHLPSSW
jgi:hypothetical protein